MKKNDDAGQKFSRRDFVKTAAVGIGATTWGQFGIASAAAADVPKRWDKAADVVVIGAGATGISAAIEATENGASVIIVEQNYDIGGHAIQSGSELGLGGGNALQKKFGIEDSPELYFNYFMNHPAFRYNDRELVRTFCEWCPPTFDWVVKHGVVFPDRSPRTGGMAGPDSGQRYQSPVWTGGISAISPTGANGTALMRPLEASARKLGVQILLEHSLTDIFRETPSSGRALGIAVTSGGKRVNIQARKGVIIGTGGHSSNVRFRQIFDVRQTEEYQVVGEPYSMQTADGEIAALKIGASLWGAANQTIEWGNTMSKPAVIGTKYGYPIGRVTGLEGLAASPLFSRMKAIGLVTKDYSDVIHVNQVGLRIVNEAANRFDWITPCMRINGGTGNGGGPIWAIFDAEAVKRENWVCTPPHVDPDGWFFSGNTLAELARNIASKYQKQPMPAAALQNTVDRYNSFVDGGKDADFGKPGIKHKIQTPPFYAAWSTPLIHDSHAGLRINTKSQVLDMAGEVIPGLYRGGESAGGFSQHGLSKCIIFGRIAGRDAATRNHNSRSRA